MQDIPNPFIFQRRIKGWLHQTIIIIISIIVEPQENLSIITISVISYLAIYYIVTNAILSDLKLSKEVVLTA